MQLLNELVECGLPLLSSLTFAYINPTYGEWDRTAGTFLYVVFFPHIIHLPVGASFNSTHLFIFKIFRDAHNTCNPDRDTTMQRNSTCPSFLSSKPSWKALAALRCKITL